MSLLMRDTWQVCCLAMPMRYNVQIHGYTHVNCACYISPYTDTHWLCVIISQHWWEYITLLLIHGGTWEEVTCMFHVHPPPHTHTHTHTHTLSHSLSLSCSLTSHTHAHSRTHPHTHAQYLCVWLYLFKCLMYAY